MTNQSSITTSSRVARTLAVVLAVALNLALAQAAERVIYRFDKTHGSQPLSGLVADSEGNLYGTTNGGGVANCGTVFELSPDSGGKFTETVLYSFRGCSFVALNPGGTMVIDKNLNLFGVQDGLSDVGVIFELKRAANGTWSYSVIHDFGSGKEGYPNVDLASDNAGNLYGTAGQNLTSQGEVFELSPQSDGSWNEKVLYTFPAPNGVSYPVAGPTIDSRGNLYGAASYGVGGYKGNGAIYELTSQAAGQWKLTVLFNFDTSFNIYSPNSRLTLDSKGNVYGTTNEPGYGQVFQLSRNSSGKWNEATIYSFLSGNDGSAPIGTLVVDPPGNVYGTTFVGGIGCNQFLCGTVYRLTPQSTVPWKETILHYFESAEDGSEPRQGLLLDSAGNLFGTTSAGGSRYGYGTVFEIVP